MGRPALRQFQSQLERGVLGAWAGGAQNVIAVLPTGGGKTVTLADIVSQHVGYACVIAHRQELVGQISLALARFGVRHRLIAPKAVIQFCVAQHVQELGRSYFDANADVAVAGVDTLVSPGRQAQMSHWARRVTLWVMDEAHHILRDNKWGRAAAMFPNARGLGVTATPERADGCGLGRHADGLMDTMVEGPTQRDLINAGWLTDYTIYAPPSDMRIDDSAIGKTGDYSAPKLAAAAKESHIVGDVVAHYKRLVEGKRGVTFAPDVDTASQIYLQYQNAGVPAQVVSGKTQDRIRAQAVRQLAKGELLQLTNCDLFGEGFDLPAIDAVSLARPTASFALFVQQIGRALRPVYAPGMPLDTPEQRKAAIAAGPKPRATVIDHVGNVVRHAVARDCPETGELIVDVCYRQWTLDAREKRSRSSDAIPLTVCLNPTGGPGGTICGKPYERVKPACPYCGYRPVPADRSRPEFVDGDLHELDPRALQVILSQRDLPVKIPHGADWKVAQAIRNRAQERGEAQHNLREMIAWWAAWQRVQGRSDSESYRRFYHLFGVDVATAQTLKRKEAEALTERVAYKLTELMGYGRSA